MQPSPGELPMAAWRLNHDVRLASTFEEHAHDFPGIAYFETAGGVLRTGRQEWSVREGDLFVIAPGDVRRHITAADLHGSTAWGVFFTPDVLGPDVPGAYLAWRTH